MRISTTLRSTTFLTLAFLLISQSCNVPQKSAGNAKVANDNYTVTEDSATKARYADHVRKTDFQTPEQERASFKLPPGFEATLFASEPDIGKPMNLEFDEKGRLWVTQSNEYPFPADSGKAKDRITILEDTNRDGKADKFTAYDDTLNIPIGIMPLTGDRAIAFSIPDLFYFTDNNHDGKADSAKTILGPFGHTDTHGMINNLLRGFDGWVYADHGFTNTSTIAGADGDSVSMTSGNTFRFKTNGSRVEQTTFGRVNPFGNAWDERGFLYSVDCHSKPIYQLIMGARYPHFGGIPSGIGYAPEMMTYALGSTALSGLVYYTGTQYPEEYRNSFYTGDVVTCRIDRNTVTFNGTTPVAHKQTPFIISGDPWFRPVDIKAGPDGAIYIADFYNRIIGHYEVPLDHPARDRKSGRIWRITYNGDAPHGNPVVKDYSALPIEDLLGELSHPQLNIRMKAADELADARKQEAIEPLTKLLANTKTSSEAVVQGLWVLQRLDALPDDLLEQAFSHTNQRVRIHAFRILSDRKSLTAGHHKIVLDSVQSVDPFIRRVASEVMQKFPNEANIAPLITLYSGTDENDSHLKFQALIALRKNLEDPEVLQKTVAASWDEAQQDVLTKAMQDLESPVAAGYVLSYFSKHPIAPEQVRPKLEYIARYVPENSLDDAIALIQNKFPNDLGIQLELYQTIKKGLQQRGSAANHKMNEWGSSLAGHFLGEISKEKDVWKTKPLTPEDDMNDAWIVRENFLTHLHAPFRILLSERSGFAPRSILYSEAFELPDTLTMTIFDNEVDQRKAKVGTSRNSVKIRLAGSDAVIGEYRFKKDTPVEPKDLFVIKKFDLSPFKGQKGYIEAVDSSASGSMGLGLIEPSSLASIDSLSPADQSLRRQQAAEIAGDLSLKDEIPRIRQIAGSRWADNNLRAVAAEALAKLDPDTAVALLGTILEDKSENVQLREKIASALGLIKTENALEALENGLAGSSRPVQITIASLLSATPQGVDRLIGAIKSENLRAELLSEISIRERLNARASEAQKSELKELTAGAANESEERQKIIDTRLAGFKAGTSSVDDGRTVFIQQCSMCHRAKNEGAMIAPQLDGTGNWGAEALATKILDPNRNISEAFRTYNISLENGKELTGLFRRNEGESVVFADLTGREFMVAKSDMKEFKASQYTLMPDQFRYTIPEKEFDALLDFLLSLK